LSDPVALDEGRPRRSKSAVRSDEKRMFPDRRPVKWEFLCFCRIIWLYAKYCWQAKTRVARTLLNLVDAWI